MELKENTYEEAFPLFENAYFGKPYKTRDGRKALYLDSFYRLTGEKNVLALEHMEDNLLYVFPDGIYEPKDAINGRKENPIDIVSEWQEPINEEELNELAYISFPKLYIPISGEGIVDTNEDYREAFKAGYRKAKSE